MTSPLSPLVAKLPSRATTPELEPWELQDPFTSCATCPLKFRSKQNLIEHMVEDHGKIPESCDFLSCFYCSKKFLHKNLLVSHLQRIHFDLAALVSLNHFADSLKHVSDEAAKEAQEYTERVELEQRLGITSGEPKVAVNEVPLPAIESAVTQAKRVKDEIEDMVQGPAGKWWCQICDKNYSAAIYFNEHFTNHKHLHNVAVIYRKKCERCGFDFTHLIKVGHRVYECVACEEILNQETQSTRLSVHLARESHLDNAQFLLKNGITKKAFEKSEAVKMEKIKEEAMETSEPNSGRASRNSVGGDDDWYDRKPEWTGLPKSPKRVRDEACEECGAALSAASKKSMHETTHKHQHIVCLQKGFPCVVCKLTYIPHNLCHCKKPACRICAQIAATPNLAKKTYPCLVCGIEPIVYTNSHMFKQHIKSHKHLHMEALLNSEKCKKCGIIATAETLPLLCKCRNANCKVCKILMENNVLAVTAGGGNLYECLTCGFEPIVFQSKSLYVQHEKSHKHMHMVALENDELCPKCGESELGEWACKCRLENCKICKYLTGIYGDKTKPTYQCNTCGHEPILFPKRSALECHEASHRHMHMFAYTEGRDCPKCGISATEPLPHNLCSCYQNDTCKICGILEKQGKPQKTTEGEHEFGPCTVCRKEPWYFPRQHAFNMHCATHRHQHMESFFDDRACEKCGGAGKDVPKGLCGCRKDNCRICEFQPHTMPQEGIFCELCSKKPFGSRKEYMSHITSHKHVHMEYIANGDECDVCGVEYVDKSLCYCKKDHCKVCERIQATYGGLGEPIDVESDHTDDPVPEDKPSESQSLPASDSEPVPQLKQPSPVASPVALDKSNDQIPNLETTHHQPADSDETAQQRQQYYKKREAVAATELDAIEQASRIVLAPKPAYVNRAPKNHLFSSGSATPGLPAGPPASPFMVNTPFSGQPAAPVARPANDGNKVKLKKEATGLVDLSPKMDQSPSPAKMARLQGPAAMNPASFQDARQHAAMMAHMARAQHPGGQLAPRMPGQMAPHMFARPGAPMGYPPGQQFGNIRLPNGLPIQGLPQGIQSALVAQHARRLAGLMGQAPHPGHPGAPLQRPLNPLLGAAPPNNPAMQQMHNNLQRPINPMQRPQHPQVTALRQPNQVVDLTGHSSDEGAKADAMHHRHQLLQQHLPQPTTTASRPPHPVPPPTSIPHTAISSAPRLPASMPQHMPIPQPRQHILPQQMAPMLRHPQPLQPPPHQHMSPQPSFSPGPMGQSPSPHASLPHTASPHGALPHAASPHAALPQTAIPPSPQTVISEPRTPQPPPPDAQPKLAICDTSSGRTISSPHPPASPTGTNKSLDSRPSEGTSETKTAGQVRREQAKATKAHHCDPCNISFGNSSHLREHAFTQRHKHNTGTCNGQSCRICRLAEGKNPQGKKRPVPIQKRSCEQCGIHFTRPADYVKHVNRHKHKHLVAFLAGQECPECNRTDLPASLCRCHRSVCKVCALNVGKTEEDDMWCTVCDFVAEDSESLEKHGQSHRHLHMEAYNSSDQCVFCGETEVPISLCVCHDCKICDIIYEKNSSLLRSCDQCDFYTFTDAEFAAHTCKATSSFAPTGYAGSPAPRSGTRTPPHSSYAQKTPRINSPKARPKTASPGPQTLEITPIPMKSDQNIIFDGLKREADDYFADSYMDDPSGIVAAGSEMTDFDPYSGPVVNPNYSAFPMAGQIQAPGSIVADYGIVETVSIEPVRPEPKKKTSPERSNSTKSPKVSQSVIDRDFSISEYNIRRCHTAERGTYYYCEPCGQEVMSKPERHAKSHKHIHMQCIMNNVPCADCGKTELVSKLCYAPGCTCRICRTRKDVPTKRSRKKDSSHGWNKPDPKTAVTQLPAQPPKPQQVAPQPTPPYQRPQLPPPLPAQIYPPVSYYQPVQPTDPFTSNDLQPLKLEYLESAGAPVNQMPVDFGSHDIFAGPAAPHASVVGPQIEFTTSVDYSPGAQRSTSSDMDRRRSASGDNCHVQLAPVAFKKEAIDDEKAGEKRELEQALAELQTRLLRGGLTAGEIQHIQQEIALKQRVLDILKKSS